MPSSLNKCLLLTTAWVLLCGLARAGGHYKNIPRQLSTGVSLTANLEPAGIGCTEPLFCQVPDQAPHDGFTLIHSDANFGSRAADSFTLAVTEQIEQVRWWGAYLVAGAPLPCGTILDDDFILTIHADAGGQPGAIVSTNPLGSSATRIQTGNQISIFGHVYDEYQLTADLVQPFVATADETYWVVIERGIVDTCAWYCETAPQGAFGNSSMLWDQNGGGYGLQNFDLAFCINPIKDCNGNDVSDECEVIALGDFNADGEVRLDDFERFAACMAGPEEPPMPEPLECASTCLAAFDFDMDDAVDLRDFASLQRAFSK